MKQKLSNVLAKYHLSGLVEESAWTIKNNNLFVKFKGKDSSVMGLVKLNDFKFQDCQFGVSEVAKFIHAISPLDSDTKVGIQLDRMYVEFKDKDVTNRRTICDVSILDLENPNPENSTNFSKDDFDIEIKLSDEFYAKMNKVKNITTNNIGIKPETNTSAKVIVNYSVNNVDNGSFDIELVKGTPLNEPILFNFDTFTKVLNTNKDLKQGKVLISSKLRIAQFVFKNEEISTLYYIVSHQA